MSSGTRCLRRFAPFIAASLAALAVGAPSAAAFTKVSDPVDVAPDGLTPRDQFYPDVGMASGGTFVVSYVEQEDGEVGSASERVWVQRFSAVGVRVGNRVQVGPNDRRVTIPSIAMAPDGRFVVAFQTDDDNVTHMNVQRFAADATPVGTVTQLEGDPDTDSIQPGIGMADDGSFAVAWFGKSQDLRVEKFAADGASQGGIQTPDPGRGYPTAFAASVGMAPDGRYTVTATRNTAVGDPETVPSWRFKADGSADGPQTLLYTGIANGNSKDTSIGRSSDGTAFLAYGDATDAAHNAYEPDIWGQSVDAAGAASGSRFTVSDYQTYIQAHPDVERAPNGHTLVAYEGQAGSNVWDGYVREFNADGTPVDTGQVLSSNANGLGLIPRIDSNGAGNFAYAWFARGATTNLSNIYVARWNAGGAAAPTPSPTPSPSPTPTPTVDPTPTPAPVPTPTPTPDTAPTPVATPLPTSAPAPTPALVPLSAPGVLPPPIAPPVPAQATCQAGKLILTDVFPLAGKTKLLGVAGVPSAGKTVSIVSTWNGKTVARLTVAKDGSFAGAVPLPPAKIGQTDDARYQAILGSQKSLQLKFARRMYTTAITASGRSLTFAGAVVKPLAAKPLPIIVRASASCSSVAGGAVVASVRPSANGTFTATFPLPAGLAAGTSVYLRAETRVRTSTTSTTTSPTFTLTRGIKLGA